ncbi:MAG: DNA cytosine methyltransferase [Treponema sp.]|nr:DNA cytosine methyltransferase [Treponema sp.]
MPNRVLTLGSLFDGIAGFPLAATRHGIKPVWASEIEAVPISVTKRHFPDMARYGDVTKINGAEIEPVDIISFGSPCQDLSIAGTRAGLEGERSSLFLQAVRIIKEMRNATARPRFAVWENVPGAFSSNGGEDFRTIIEELARIAKADASIPRPPARGANTESVWDSAGAVMGDGWSIAWRTLDAKYFGVPQRRRRIFLVADFGGTSAAEILFEPEGERRDFKAGGKTRERTAAAVAEGFGETGRGYWQNGIQCLRAKGDRPSYPSNVVLLNDQGGSNTIERSDNAGAGGTGVNEELSYTLSATDRYAVAYDCRNSVVNGDVSGTLQSKENGEYSLNYINPVVTFQYQRSDKYKKEDVSNTLAKRDYKSATNLVVENYAVHRITPTECERLQGFPDDWTAYGHDGKPISDSARYRALGNSVAVPCVEFIMAGLRALGEEKK